MIPCAACHYWRSNDPVWSECVMVHCQWGRKPVPGDRRCGLSSTCRRRTEPRTCATCTKNLVKIARVVPEISSRTDRQTDILITILCNRTCGRSNISRHVLTSDHIILLPLPIIVVSAKLWSSKITKRIICYFWLNFGRGQKPIHQMVGLYRSCDEENINPFQPIFQVNQEEWIFSVLPFCYTVTTSNIPVLVGQSTLSYRCYTKYPVRASMGEGNSEGPTA